MSADFTFDPGLVFDDTTMTTAKNATGVLRDVAGGSVQPVYDLLGNPLSGLSTNEFGYVGRFKADIGKGVLDFGSITQPVFSWDYFTADSIGAGSPSASGVLSSVRAEAAGFTLFENVGGQGYSYINPTGWTFGPLESGTQTGMVDTADGSMATTVEGWYTGRLNVQIGWPTTGPDWVFPNVSTYSGNLGQARMPIPQLPPFAGISGHSLKGVQASIQIEPFYSPAYVSGGGYIGALLEWAGSYGSPKGPNNTAKPFLRFDIYRIA